MWLASSGGGIATYRGNVCSIGEPVGLNGKTSDIIPIVRVMDPLKLGILQGSLRRGSAARYFARKVCDLGQTCFTETEWSAAKQGVSASTFSRPMLAVLQRRPSGFHLSPVMSKVDVRSQKRNGAFGRNWTINLVIAND